MKLEDQSKDLCKHALNTNGNGLIEPPWPVEPEFVMEHPEFAGYDDKEVWFSEPYIAVIKKFGVGKEQGETSGASLLLDQFIPPIPYKGVGVKNQYIEAPNWQELEEKLKKIGETEKSYPEGSCENHKLKLIRVVETDPGFGVLHFQCPNCKKGINIIAETTGIKWAKGVELIDSSGVHSLGKLCPNCGQVDEGQTGENPCFVCGLPLTHDVDNNYNNYRMIRIQDE